MEERERHNDLGTVANGGPLAEEQETVRGKWSQKDLCWVPVFLLIDERECTLKTL